MVRLVSSTFLNVYLVGGGLWHSEMISKGVISAYVPFLPLELEHVRDCIRTHIRDKGLPITEIERFITTVAAEILFQPSDHPIFSVTGCRAIPDHVKFVREQYNIR